jgi:hypothetical protein
VTDSAASLGGGRYGLSGSRLGFRYTPYHENLLALARQLIQEGRHQLAVVVAQMASEVLAEQVLAARLERRNLGELEKWIDWRTPSSNLSSEIVLKLYVALTGDQIQEQPFWGDYKAHVELRNDIVHGGRQVDLATAEKSVEVVSKLLQHLAAVLQRAGE